MKAARVYAKLGWAVIPLHDVTAGRCSCPKGELCHSAGKHPRLNEWQKEATSDLETVDAWIAAFPSANVGAATGAASGFFVLDVDGPAGESSLERWREDDCHIPETATARTGSGGTHYLFRMPSFDVRNSAHKLYPGIDIRGSGGQIVIPPSVSAKGRYTWIRAPWEVEIAEAPEWLLEEIRSASRPVEAGPSEPPRERGYFPPASPALLTLAREALARHGPAVENSGGDEHTFRACAILAHDFALTDDEAWPLLAEWNETCQPPWGEGELRAKLRGGSKYGTATYGKRRTLDVRDRAWKLIEDWRSAGTDETTTAALGQKIREICANGVDPVDRELIERKWTADVNLSKTSLALPKVAPVGAPAMLPEGAIELTPRLAQVADAAFAVLQPHVYARGGVLCVVAKPDRTFIHELEPVAVQDLMSANAKWVRTKEGAVVEESAPLNVASILHARREHKNARILEAVTTAPIFLADGTILEKRGYNAKARVFLEPSVAVDVPDEPTLDDARAAARLLHGLVSDFKFRERADFTSWLAGLLSPLVKTATGNAPAPLICVSASNPGAGKSLLTDLISQIVTGEKAELSPYNPKDPAEWGKRLTAFVKAGSPVRVLDNCNGPIGDEALDRLITSSRWSDRILGASEAPPLPNVTTWFATGNNIEPTGDTVRRVLMCRIEVNTERPQERKGFALDLEGGYAVEHRSELLGAALTILRAWHCANRPKPAYASWGSFTGWSSIVRSAIVWTGLADPYLTQARATLELNETDSEQHDFWLTVIEDSDGSETTIAALANTRKADEVLGLRDQLHRHNLKKFVGRFVDKPRSGKRIRREVGGACGPRYYVETISGT